MMEWHNVYVMQWRNNTVGNLDLEKLARLYPEVELNTERFAAAIVRIVPPNSCGLVFGVR